MENVALSAGLHCLTSGVDFNQSMVDVALPGGLLSLTVCFDVNQCIENEALTRDPQSFTLGVRFDQIIGNVALPYGLENEDVFGRQFVFFVSARVMMVYRESSMCAELVLTIQRLLHLASS